MKGRNLNLQVGSLEIKWVGKSVIDGIKAVGDRDYSSAQAWRYRVQSPDNWSLFSPILSFLEEGEIYVPLNIQMVHLNIFED